MGYSLVIDGYFGPKTQSAVIDFQKNNRLETDGIVGPQTWNALFNR
ncbi:MAG: peptidoglycan-binding domain-containing protein [Patescibacteria group bacterium]